MYKHILVPTDGSPLSMKAVKTATKLAQTINAKITALHVLHPYAPPIMEDAVLAYSGAYSPKEYKKTSEARARKVLDEVKQSVEKSNVECATEFVADDQPWNAIVNAAKGRKCDLIVMASHGRRGLAGVLIGSETTKVLTHSKTPVLVCR